MKMKRKRIMKSIRIEKMTKMKIEAIYQASWKIMRELVFKGDCKEPIFKEMMAYRERC